MLQHRRVVINLHLDGTPDQARCICHAVAMKLDDAFMQSVIGPVSRSESIPKVEWDVIAQKLVVHQNE